MSINPIRKKQLFRLLKILLIYLVFIFVVDFLIGSIITSSINIRFIDLITNPSILITLVLFTLSFIYHSRNITEKISGIEKHEILQVAKKENYAIISEDDTKVIVDTKSWFKKIYGIRITIIILDNEAKLMGEAVNVKSFKDKLELYMMNR
ncbi:hypothetical protein [Desulfuribacillus alkaliarsenatis]|uniref:Uncharacterized protein n=1 Tax=Desulfuribacillus alkaliarsenatis TaxID=766136 RepID=A0A1E5FZH5_9FIRM|nr:hypothetical protein [Desulfuribacillus alkaliarsenatis]OEF95976.1 hypothetical protein BHF68_09495 [Desulfuribacillus alkaliarsenatis]